MDPLYNVCMCIIHIYIHTQYPKPSTLNPKASTLNSEPKTLNPNPSTLNIYIYTYTVPQTLNPKP